MKKIFSVLVAVLLVVPISAQQPAQAPAEETPVAAYVAAIYKMPYTATSEPVWTARYSVAEMICGPGVGNAPEEITITDTTGPLRFGLDDPKTSGSTCVSPEFSTAALKCTGSPCPSYLGAIASLGVVDGKEIMGGFMPATPILNAAAPIQVQNCVVSDWGEWSAWTPWSPLDDKTEAHTQTRVRTIVTPALNGGTPCPAPEQLMETHTETRSTPPTVDPACVAPLGAQAASVFPGRFLLTTKVPGSKMRVDYQLGSKSPVVEIRVKVDGTVVRSQIGTDLTGDGAMWFTQPDYGTYKVSIWIKNAYGCTKEAYAPTSLTLSR